MSRLFNCLKVLLLVLLPAVLTTGCDDTVLTDAGAQPRWVLPEGEESFSLGMLFVGRTSPWQSLMLYNPQKDGALELTSVALRGGAESIFRINVDGMAGHTFTQRDLLRIAPGDSLCVMVDARFVDTQTERTVEREDWLDIVCNGRQQSLRLTVTTCDADELRKVTIASDTLWAGDGLDKLLFDTLTIAAGATLTISEGVTLYLHDKAHIHVLGTLRLLGSAEKPVTLQGDRTDHLFPNLLYVDMAAQWDGITIDTTSQHNRFEHAVIKGMDSGITLRQTVANRDFMASARDDVDADDPKRFSYGPEFLDADDPALQATFRHCRVRNSNGPLITAYNSNLVIENSELQNGAKGLVHLYGGAIDITHCTLANYCYWQACQDYDLIIANHDPDDDSRVYPMWRCNLTNSIVYGRWNQQQNVGVLFRRYQLEGLQSDSILNYRMTHSLIYAPTATMDDDLIEMLFNDDPKYQHIDPDNYLSDVHLQPTSPAAQKGSPRTVGRLPLDLDGKPRADQPSMGCYEAAGEN